MIETLYLIMAWQDPHTKTWTLPNREWHQSSKNEWDTWDCSVCASSNWLHHGAQKKKCRTCGVKRSYRDVAAAAAPSVSGTTQNSVKCMLQNVSEQLLSVSKPCNPNPPVDAAPTAVGGIVSMTPAEKKTISDEIASLEASAASLPLDAEYDDVRTSIRSKITAKMKLIVTSKPIGARVDACKLLVERCRTHEQ